MPDKTRRRAWPETMQGAVSLSYDGGDISHLETAASCLDALCLRATFYVPPTRILEAPVAWKALASSGHEIGNGGLFDGAGSDGLLHGWSPQMVENDLSMSEQFYRDTFPKNEKHSLALPLPAGDGPDRRIELAQQATMIRPLFRDRFSVVRGTSDGYNAARDCDLRALRCFRIVDHTYEELVVLAEAARAAKSWAIFAFQGIGVGDPAIDAVDHAKFCLWLAERRDRLMVAPVFEIGNRVRRFNSAAVDAKDLVEADTHLGQTV
jgi:hypothetical protein